MTINRRYRTRGYTDEWDRLSANFKRRCPVCIGCWVVGLETRTEIVDHIKPLANDQAGLLDINNLQPACRWHHDNIKRSRRPAAFDAAACGTRSGRRSGVTCSREWSPRAERSAGGAGTANAERGRRVDPLVGCPAASDFLGLADGPSLLSRVECSAALHDCNALSETNGISIC